MVDPGGSESVKTWVTALAGDDLCQGSCSVELLKESASCSLTTPMPSVSSSIPLNCSS